ncbi:MAG: cbb3-type cytochrome c oxidase subunit I, partial [Gammaproteobacteria bacterium]|nr:cbb3-type cytochrome c oxidase subunit I [Gammaproteobacteria bacterium]
IPLLFGRKAGEMYSVKLINLHFWMATLGTVLYIASMWVNGLLQGLMWRATTVDGTLTYSFVESVEASYPGYYVRFLGGAIFFLGMCIMGYNVWRTVRGEQRAETAAPATPLVAPGGSA